MAPVNEYSIVSITLLVSKAQHIVVTKAPEEHNVVLSGVRRTVHTLVASFHLGRCRGVSNGRESVAELPSFEVSFPVCVVLPLALCQELSFSSSSSLMLVLWQVLLAYGAALSSPPLPSPLPPVSRVPPPCT